MAKQEHYDIIKQGVEIWNKWRQENPEIKPDLRDVDLSNIQLLALITRKFTLGYHPNFFNASIIGADLTGTDLTRANLTGANMIGADLKAANLEETILVDSTLVNADFSGAKLKKAKLTKANLNSAAFVGTDLSGADLREVSLFKSELTRSNLHSADLSKALLYNVALSDANLTRANLSYADLTGANFVGTILTEANLTGCRVYGISVWDISLEDTIQQDLVITPDNQPNITVDSLEVAQFIYLLLNNKKIRDIINTITSKVVLILGRFTAERKVVLDALRDELRDHNNYLPVVFDFEKPTTRDLTETVSTLAHLARFIIIDLTDPSSAPHEAATIIPQCVVPVQPLLIQDDSRHEYAMFQDLRRRYDWVLPTYRYQDIPSLLASLKEHIIDPAELKAQELERRM